MYRLIRNLHLYSSLALVVFVVMYFVSGYIIIHGEALGMKPPRKTVREASLATVVGSNAQEVAAALENQFGLRGRLLPLRQRKGGAREFTFARPGVVEQ